MLPYKTSIPDGARERLPLQIEPQGDASADGLTTWLHDHRHQVQDLLRAHGALRFHGFGIHDAAAFEAVVRGVDDDLKNEYLGTSPRDAMTDYVFSASELPGYYPIPQHCEMTFTRTPPNRIFFWCDIAPRAGSGETPLVDFRRVWSDLDDGVRERFARNGLRIIRNYSGPGTTNRDLFQLKRWDEMFRTEDRDEVNRMARREGFTPIWKDGDRLALVSEHEATRNHPETGEPTWFNHAQVFHLSTGSAELKRVFRHRPSARGLFWWLAASLLTARKRKVPSEEQAMHCTYRDGHEIPDADLEHLRDIIWRNLVVLPWSRGDVVAIDNHAVGHGRLPYKGPRRVAVCWA